MVHIVSLSFVKIILLLMRFKRGLYLLFKKGLPVILAKPNVAFNFSRTV